MPLLHVHSGLNKTGQWAEVCAEVGRIGDRREVRPFFGVWFLKTNETPDEVNRRLSAVLGGEVHFTVCDASYLRTGDYFTPDITEEIQKWILQA